MAGPAGTIEFALLHGGAQGSWVWEETVAALRQAGGERVGRVLLLDMPGCGTRRSVETASMTMADVLEDLFRQLDGAGLRNAVLVGHSQAGTMLPLLIEGRPGLFSRAIYVSCCAPLKGQTVLEMMGGGQHGDDPGTVGWRLPPATTPPETLAAAMFCNDMEASGTEAFMRRFGADSWPEATMTYRDWDRDEAMRVGPPSSYVVLTDDASLPPEWQQRFAERFGAERVVQLEAGHQAMQTRPGALADVLIRQARPAAAT